jgi:CotH kinase protein
LARVAAEGRCPRGPEQNLELPTWDLYVSTEHWAALHEDVQAELSVTALLCVAGRPYPIDLELQGASSRKLQKKSFDLKFKKQRPLEEAPFGEPESLRRILLKAMANDQTLIREALAFEAYRGLGYLAPRVGFANLRINGAYWGLYNLVEPINEDFLVRSGLPEGGHLYKAIRTKQGRADFKPGRELRSGFEDKSEQATEDWPDLKALASKLQRTPTTYDAFMREIDPRFSLAAYMDRMIWVAVTQNSDAVAQNFYLYNAPCDGQDAWTMLPWDSNVAFGAHWIKPYLIVPPEEAPMVDGGNYFGPRLLEVETLRAQYVARFHALLAGGLSSETLRALATELAARVEHDLAVDQARWQRELDPDQAFAALETFLDARPDVLRAALSELE